MNLLKEQYKSKISNELKELNEAKEK